MMLPALEHRFQIMFSSIDGNRSILIRSMNKEKELIKIWRHGTTAPLNMVTILEQPCSMQNFTYSIQNYFVQSPDNSMIAICNTVEQQKDCKVMMLYSIDNHNISISLKQSFTRCFCRSIQFTPDGKYISYLNENGLAFWNKNTGREITDQINIKYDKFVSSHLNSFHVMAPIRGHISLKNQT
jgi:hypothetical protein